MAQILPESNIDRMWSWKIFSNEQEIENLLWDLTPIAETRDSNGHLKCTVYQIAPSMVIMIGDRCNIYNFRLSTRNKADLIAKAIQIRENPNPQKALRQMKAIRSAALKRANINIMLRERKNW